MNLQKPLNMAAFNFLMIHCSATPEGREIKPADIVRMHTAPVAKGGRGWGRVGYARFITLDGTNHILRGHNENNWIEADEITNGAVGYNDRTRHICYAGGCAKDGKTAKDTRTTAQLRELARYVQAMIVLHPQIQVMGHNQVSAKDCPSFNVPKWLREIGVDEKHIYKKPGGK